MASVREGSNPLRPYYIPPSIGLPPEPTSAPKSASNGFNGSTSTYAASAREIFSDIDYSDYVSEESKSTVDMVKSLLDQAVYKYTSVLLAQPFEVAKTVLQVRTQAVGDGGVPVTDEEELRSGSYRDSMYGGYASDESDPDEPAYFTSSAPLSTSYSPPRSRRRRISDRSGYAIHPPSSRAPGPHQLVLRRPDAINEVISQLWTVEGAWGVWKGSNATFIYSVALKTVESWSRGMLAAIVNIPDPGGPVGLGMMELVDIADAPYPWVSLAVTVGAAAMAGLLLAPLDIVRTKLIVTSTSMSKRGFLHNLKQLPSFTCPPSLIFPTLFHSVIPPLLSQCSQLVLRTKLAIDPVLTPATYSVATFCSSIVELFLRLPFETVLRRGQMAVASSPRYLGVGKPLESVVDVGEYRGTLGTMWLIVREEGISSTYENAVAKTANRAVKRPGKLGERKGQGIEGLWRGWRVGFWGLVGVWGAGMLRAAGGGEF